MTKTLLALAAAAITLGSVPVLAQTYDPYARTYIRDYRAYPSNSYRTQWPAGTEQNERSVTRQLNNEQANQPTQYYYPPQYSYVPPPQYSYVPQPQYSYAPQPTYAYPYNYPPRPWTPRY